MLAGTCMHYRGSLLGARYLPCWIVGSAGCDVKYLLEYHMLLSGLHPKLHVCVSVSPDNASTADTFPPDSDILLASLWVCTLTSRGL